MYSTWTVSRLKNELQLRGASLCGRKADLVSRLESFDRNSNFYKPQHDSENKVCFIEMPKFISKMPFYAVARGRTPGIFMTWGDCEAQVKGFSGARYKKFDSADAAQTFIQTESGGIAKGKPATKAKPSYSIPNKSYHNLKRSLSTTAENHKKSNGENHHNDVSLSCNNKSKPRRKRSDTESDYDSNEQFSDESDDNINNILNKQMDDIEKRLKGFEKGVDKIIKKNSSKSSQKKTILIEPPQPKRRRSANMEFIKDADGYVQVFTDGACSSNGLKGARAGYGVYWGDGHTLNTSEPVSGRATNNCGEIQAASCAIKQAIQNGVKQLAINTDSQFLINSVTKWIPGWKTKGWKLKSGEPVKNEADFKELDSLQKKIALKWNYVEAHKGIHGNEMADQLAKEGAAKYNKVIVT